jgi:sugar lactone lactonase YvrE
MIGVALLGLITLTAQGQGPGTPLATPLGCTGGICSYLYVNSISLYGGDAQGLAIDQKGNLYIAENVNGLGITPQGPFVVAVDPEGTQKVLVPAGVLGDVTALALDQAGNLYIADGNGYGGGQPPCRNTVWKLDLDGTMSEFALVNDPSGLAFDAQGNLYVSSWSDGAVYEFTPAGQPLATVLSGLASSSLPYGVAIDRAGNLYVAGYGTHYSSENKIYKVTPSGSVSVFVDPPISYGSPASLVFDRAGNLYAGYYNSLEILKISPDGSYVTFPGGGIGPDAPNGLAVDRHGDLFVAVNGSRTTSLPAVVRLTGIVPQ